MWRGIFALFFRSLRSDSRSLAVHTSWLLLLLVIYVAMLFAQFESRFVGAPGLRFFQTVTLANAVFITLLAIGYFSSAISEEKEEDTLGLMRMAGISPLGILLGKSTTRLFQVLILLAVQYPFTKLAITLGGLMPDQVYAAYAALMAYTILLANAGLICSVLCRTNRDASALTTLWILGYLITPLFAYGGYAYLINGNASINPYLIPFKPALEVILSWTYQSSVFGQLVWVTETGYQFSVTPQLASNAIGGCVLFFLSWWLFTIMPQDVAAESTTRLVAPRKTGGFRWFDAGRVWNHALVWKDFHFIAGGWIGILMRVGLYVGLYWLAFGAMYPWHHEPKLRQINWRDATEGFQFFVVPLFVVDCALCMSRLFHEEIRQQTLASLLMLPRSVRYVVYHKIGGCLLGLVPGMIAFVAAFFLLSDATKVWPSVIIYSHAWFIIANLFLLVNLSAMFSTYLRRGAFILSLVYFGGSMLFTQVVFQYLSWQHNWAQMVLGLSTIPVVLACIGCQLIIIYRLPALGEKS